MNSANSRTVYFISGLGADERSFRYLELRNVEKRFIQWEKPLKGEKLRSYCERLIAQIDTSKDVVLVGLSFGGIVAQEIAKIINVKKLIIVSSVKSPGEFSWQLQLVKKLSLHKAVPSKVLKWSNLLTGKHYFSVTNKEEAALLKQIIKDTDRYFMKWAIAEIMGWEASNVFPGLVHIHGEKDRIFPVTNIRNYKPIKDAGHFMIVNRAKEIAHLLEHEFEK